MKKLSMVATVVVSVAVLLGMVLPACAPQAAPKQTPTTQTPATQTPKSVKVGLGLPFTGPVADVSEKQSVGHLDAIRYVNEVKGGIDGVKIDAIWEDTAYSADKATALYKRFRDQNVLWTMFHGSGVNEALAASFSRDQNPNTSIFNASPTMMSVKPRYVFPYLASYPDETGAFFKWVKDGWKESRAPRIGVIAADAAYGRVLQTDLPDYAKELGIDLLPMEFVPSPVTDVTIELGRLMSKNPDWVFIQIVGTGAVVTLRDAAKLGVKDKTKWIVFLGAFDQTLITQGKENAEGVYGMVTSALPTADQPMVKEANKYIKLWRNRDAGLYEYQGWIDSLIAMEGLRIALKDAGYDKLNGPAIMNAWLKIKDFDLGGIAPALTVNPELAIAQPGRLICQIQNGNMVSVTDWIKTPIVTKYK